MTSDAQIYQILIAGHLDDHWSAWLGLSVARHDDGTSTLTGPVTDQAQLHGILAQLRDVGVNLISLRPIEGTDGQGGADSPPSVDGMPDERMDGRSH